jgi:hypothetical protein
MSDTFDDILRWSTLGGAEGDPAASPDEIQDFFEAELAELGTLHDGTDTLPSGATERPNGTFSNIGDLVRYLDAGALIFRDADGNYVPNPIVHIVHFYDEIFDQDIYETWIDEDT